MKLAVALLWLAPVLLHGAVATTSGGPSVYRHGVGVAPEFLRLLSALKADYGIQLEPIPAGIFSMGSAVDEHGRASDEGPLHRVALTRDFYIGATEVTNAQWAALVGPRTFPPPSEPRRGNPGRGPTPLEPNGAVTNLSWGDAVGFCGKLNAKYGALMPVGWRFTLPTEAQWEYACRARTEGPYAGDPRTMVWLDTNGPTPRRQVAQKLPNGWGLYDMHGGAWEWVADWYGPYSGDEQKDPEGPLAGEEKVLRGAKWGAPEAGWAVDGTRGIPPGRSAVRRNISPTSSVGGFRLALTHSTL